MLNLLLLIRDIASWIFSFWILVKKPSLPVLMPRTGILESLTYVIDLKIVPSPPMEKTKLISFSIGFFESKKENLFWASLLSSFFILESITSWLLPEIISIISLQQSIEDLLWNAMYKAIFISQKYKLYNFIKYYICN